MWIFLGLCIGSRLAYAVNDIWVGRIARQHDSLDVAALRGLCLGLTMAPLLFWVPSTAGTALIARSGVLLATVALTAGSNILQLYAARYLPFGIRAALIVTGVSTGSILFGSTVLAERLTPLTALLCLVLVGSAVVAARGEHASHEIVPNIPRGTLLAFGSAALMAVVALLLKQLSDSVHPLLLAWAWEFGAGAVLLGPVVIRAAARRLGPSAQPQTGARQSLGYLLRIGLSSSPTVIGSAASVLALRFGSLTIWGALAGTQVLFTAALAGVWHRETIGPRRWLCFLVASVAVAILAIKP